MSSVAMSVVNVCIYNVINNRSVLGNEVFWPEWLYKEIRLVRGTEHAKSRNMPILPIFEPGKNSVIWVVYSWLQLPKPFFF